MPYCGAAPLPGDWLERWNFDPLLLVAMTVALIATSRLPADRRIAPISAVACFGLLFVSPFCALSSALFAARVVHHVLLATVLAPLIAHGFASYWQRLPGSLTVWTAVQALAFWLWHAPPFYAAALSNDAIFWLMQAGITIPAAIWWAKLRTAPDAAAVASLLAAMVLMGVLGALITFAGRALYAPHWLTTQAWGLSPLEDQQIGGLIMWAPASAVYLLAAMAVLYQSLGTTGAAPAERS